MTVGDLSRIDRTIEVNAPPDRVWRALTTAEELSAWFQVRIEGDIVPDTEVWMTSVHPQHAGQRFRVLFREMTPPHRFVWEWHPGEVDPGVDYSREPRTTVTFTLEPSERGTKLSVSETGFDAISLARRAQGLQGQQPGLGRSPGLAAEVCRSGALNRAWPAPRCCSRRSATRRGWRCCSACLVVRPRSRCSPSDFGAMTRQGVTKHLHVLADAGIIDGHRQGREQVWTLNPARLAECRRCLELIARGWDDALARLKTHIEDR